MVGANVKQETLTLMEKKAGIEAEMEAIITRLQPPAGPGLSGNLLDKDVSRQLNSLKYSDRISILLDKKIGLNILSCCTWVRPFVHIWFPACFHKDYFYFSRGVG